MIPDSRPPADRANPPIPYPSRESTLFPPRDRHLLDGCIHADPAAWDAFVERFAGLLAFVVDRTASQRRVPLGPADRDDLLADILLELIHHDAEVLRTFTGRSTLATYLAVVARRVVVRGLSSIAARGGREPGDPVSDRPGGRDRIPPAPEGEDPTESLVRLHDLEGRSYGEISRITGMPLGAIGPALAMARRKLGRTGG